MKDYGQIISLIGTLKTICHAMQKQKFQQDVINDIETASEQINVQLYYIIRASFYDFNKQS